MKKICFITGSRADYGLLTPLMSLVKKDKKFLFQLIATGSHVSKKATTLRSKTKTECLLFGNGIIRLVRIRN